MTTGEQSNMGTYNRNFEYYDSEFCSFDKSLFATWKNKDSIEFGNAVKNGELTKHYSFSYSNSETS